MENLFFCLLIIHERKFHITYSDTLNIEKHRTIRLRREKSAAMKTTSTHARRCLKTENQGTLLRKNPSLTQLCLLQKKTFRFSEEMITSRTIPSHNPLAKNWEKQNPKLFCWMELIRLSLHFRILFIDFYSRNNI